MDNNVPHHQYADGPNPKIFSDLRIERVTPKIISSASTVFIAWSLPLYVLICLTMSKYSNEMLRI